MAGAKHSRVIVGLDKCFLANLFSEGLARRVKGRILRVQHAGEEIHVWLRVTGQRQALRDLYRRIARVQGGSYTILAKARNTHYVHVSFPESLCGMKKLCPLAYPTKKLYASTALVRAGRVAMLVLASTRKDVDMLEARGFRVLGVVEDPDSVELTEAQEQAILTSFEAGYYETPRRSSLRRLANITGVSLGAIAERLRNAESKIVRRVILEEVVLSRYIDENAGDRENPENGR